MAAAAETAAVSGSLLCLWKFPHRLCLTPGKPCPSVAAAGAGAAPPPGTSSGGGAAAALLDTTPPIISLGNASCAGGTGSATNARAVTATGVEVVVTSVPVGEQAVETCACMWQ